MSSQEKNSKVKKNKTSENIELNPKKIDVKQIIVGLIILAVAIIMFVSTLKQEPKPTVSQDTSAKEENVVTKEPQIEGVVVTIETTTEEAIQYGVFYTTSKDAEFDVEHYVYYQGESGTHEYNIALPVESIERFRLAFNNASGHITVNKVTLGGTQEANLSNFTQYGYYQIENLKLNDDDSISFDVLNTPVYMVYRPNIPQPVKEVVLTSETNENQEAEVSNEETDATNIETSETTDEVAKDTSSTSTSEEVAETEDNTDEVKKEVLDTKVDTEDNTKEEDATPKTPTEETKQ